MAIDVFDFAVAPSHGPSVRVGPPVGQRGRRILRTIANYQRLWGYAPTIRDIQELADVPSTSEVDYWLQKLRRQGYLTFRDGAARTIRLTGLRVPDAERAS